MTKIHFHNWLLRGMIILCVCYTAQITALFAGQNAALGNNNSQNNNEPGSEQPFLGYDLDSSNRSQSNIPGDTNTENEGSVFVDSIITNESRILSGKVQLIQVNLINTAKTDKRFEMRIRIITPDGKDVFLPFRKIIVHSRSVESYLYRYTTDPDLQGDYKLEVNLVVPGSTQPRFRFPRGIVFTSYLLNVPAPLAIVDTDSPPEDIYALFDTNPEAGNANLSNNGAVNGQNTGAVSAQNGNPGTTSGNSANTGLINTGVSGAQINTGVNNNSNIPGGSSGTGQNPDGTGAGAVSSGGSNTATANRTTDGNYIDMKWINLRLSTDSVLRGETFTVSLFLLNNGTQIAENVTYKIYLIRELYKSNYLNISPYIEGNYPFIAPGETKLVNFPVTIDTELPPDQYVLVAHIDPENNIIAEIDKDNNFIISDQINFTEILPVDPENNLTINSNAEITFSWRSNRYVLFQVQISQDEKFAENSVLMQMPTTDPTPLSSVTMLRGEVESLKQYVTPDKNIFYWRVVGFDSQNNRVVSNVRKFYFNIL